MAITKEINVVVNTSNAEKNVNDLTKSFNELSKKAEEIEEALANATDPKEIAFLTKQLKDVNKELGVTEKNTEKLSKTTSNSKKNVGLLSKGFKFLGDSMKAAGIGLIVSVVAGLTAAFSQNQRVVNVLSGVFETMGIVLFEVTEALFAVYDSVSKSSENFNGLGKAINGLLTLSVTPLKLAWYGIKLAIQETQLAWESSVFGGKDADTIEALNKSILETKNDIVEVGAAAVQAGVDIYENYGDAVGEIVNIGKTAGEELGKISIKNAYEQGKANVEIKNTAKLAAAQQQLLVEKYDILAEKQRQIRDEERNSIDDRIKANNELGDVLDKQQKAMLAAADAQVAAAQVDVEKNKTIEAQVALTEALANKQGVLAQIEGFRSEQLVNDLALKREQIELDNTINDREKQRQLEQLEFEAELAQTEADKNIKLQERLDLENEIILEDLERKKELYAEGTLARIEAEQDYLDAEQSIKQKQASLDKKISDEVLANEKKNEEEKIKLDEQTAEAKNNIANRTADLLIALGGKAAKVGKAIAVAQTIRSGIEGVQSAYTTAQKSPITIGFPAYPIVQAGLAGAFSALQVKSLLSTPDTGGSATASTTSTETSAPSFNLVQGTPENQLATTISNSVSTPVQAYVVSSNVTTAQSLDRNKIDESSI